MKRELQYCFPPNPKHSGRYESSTLSFLSLGECCANSVLSSDMVEENIFHPAFLRTAHAFPLLFDYDKKVMSCYASGGNCSFLQRSNYVTSSVDKIWWTPGGNGVGHYVVYALPEPTLCDRYIVETKSTAQPFSWIVEGSIDGSEWVLIDIVDNAGVFDSVIEEKTFTIPVVSRGSFKYYRFKITGSNSASCSIRSLSFFVPEVICPRNGIQVRASVQKPLVLCFSSGRDSNGAAILHTEAITSPLFFPIDSFVNMFLPDDPAIVTTPSPTENTVVCFFALRNPASGEVSFHVQDILYNRTTGAFGVNTTNNIVPWGISSHIAPWRWSVNGIFANTLLRHPSSNVDIWRMDLRPFPVFGSTIQSLNRSTASHSMTLSTRWGNVIAGIIPNTLYPPMVHVPVFASRARFSFSIENHTSAYAANFIIPSLSLGVKTDGAIVMHRLSPSTEYIAVQRINLGYFSYTSRDVTGIAYSPTSVPLEPFYRW